MGLDGCSANEGRRKRERQRGERDGDVPAGEQMVAPFIGLFVGSAITSRPPACVPLFCSSNHPKLGLI